LAPNRPGRHCYVTGSARGIAKAIAERFGRLGASLVVNYSGSEERAKDTVATIERLGGTAIAVQADVSKVADIDRLFTAAMRRFNHLDIVVANAGIELVGKQVVDRESPRQLVAVNNQAAGNTHQQNICGDSSAHPEVNLEKDLAHPTFSVCGRSL